MKVLKRLILSLMLACMIVMGFPSLFVNAAGDAGLSIAVRNSISSCSVSSSNTQILQGYDVPITFNYRLKFKAADGTEFYTDEQMPYTGSGKTAEAIISMAESAMHDGERYIAQYHKPITKGGVEYKCTYCQCMSVTAGTAVPSYVSKSETTRHYGYTVYCGTVTATKSSPTDVSMADVDAAFTAGNASYKKLGVARVGGQDDFRPMNEATEDMKALANSIKAYSSNDPKVFFSTFGSYFPGQSCETLSMQIKGATDTVSLPFMCATLAMSAGHSGGVADVISGHLNPWIISWDQGMSFFAKYDGGDSLLGSLAVAGNSSIVIESTIPMFSKYVYPYGSDNIPIPEADFIFGVASTPKDGTSDWDKPASDRQGSFTVNVRAKEPTNIEPNIDYTITVTTTKVNAMYDGPFLSTVNITTPPEVKTVKGSELASETPVFIKFNVTGDGPADRSDDALNKGVLKINVTVSGGGQTYQATFVPKSDAYPNLSDDMAKGSGKDGYNYVAWKYLSIPIDIPDLELVPWAQHSAADPLVNGTLGASEYSNEDWDIGNGIPSTENVYVLAGAETAVSDLAGYFVIFCSDGKHPYKEVKTSNQGENQPGDSSGNPAVTREIDLMCSVQNTWGWDNTLCHRQAAEFNISGGWSSYQGGGSAYSVSGHKSHSSNHGSHGDNGTCKKTYGSQTNIGGWGPCSVHGTKWSASSGAWSGTKYDCGHNSCSSCGGCGEDDNGNETHPACGADQNKTCPPRTVDHDCTWSLSVYDGDKNDGVNNGVLGTAAVDLPQSFTIEVSDWSPLQLSSFKVIDYVSNGGNDIGADAWKSKLISCSKAHDSNAQVKGSVTFTQQGNQYFHLSGSFQVRQEAKEKKACWANDNHFDTNPEDKTAGAGSEELKTLTPSNPSGVLCNGYSYGTGSKCDEFENCYHLYEHNYSLKYLERIDFYVFRSVTDAHLAALRGSEIAGVNQVTRSGYPEDNGTFGAPIDSSAVGESATAPESVGYLWRCINSKYGAYVNGEGLANSNGEYNGRILFEIWKEPEAGAAGALSYEFNTNFCLGNAQIKAVLQQDNEFGNDPVIKAQYHPTEALTSVPSSVPNRGSSEDRYQHNYVTSQEKTKGSGSMYAGKEGDCLNKDWQMDTNWRANDDMSKQEYKEIVIAEQNAIVNFWQGKNKDDNYHANIISDNMCYGGSENTTQVIGEYYTVDDGIPLFNYLGGTKGRTKIDDEEGPIYRNHHSKVGSTKGALSQFILNYNAPSMPSMNDGDHYGFFGFGGGADGGDTPLSESLTGKCVEGTVYEIENGNKGSWTPGADVIDAYRRKLGAKAINPSPKPTSGITEFQSYLPSSPISGGDSFEGYWNDHTYPAHVSETIQGRCNNSSGNTLAWEELSDFTFSGTNSGTLNQQQYGESLLMHNLALVDWTPNGVWPTVDLSNKYGWLLDVVSGIEEVTKELYADGVYEIHKTIVTDGMGMGLPTTIRIYDPISAENSHNIGNQYGNFSGDEVNTPDESEYDQRVTSIGKAKNDYSAIGNYVNTNTYLWTWIAPFGDFNSVGGSGPSADITTGTVNKGGHGYVDDMYIGTWTKDVKINYPFVGKAKNNDKVSTEFYIGELDSVYGSGNSNYMEAQYGPDNLQHFYTSRENPVFKFGNAVGAKNTVDLVEGKDLPVTVTAYAINDGIKSSDNSCSFGESVNGSGANTDKFCNAASKEIPIDLVGQIGNLAIHDTTDFRFSTYFKKAIDDSWLIDGIVLNTDDKEPMHILAAPKDILFQNAKSNRYTHSTLGITDMNAPLGGKGMSGEFGLLPLTPAYITVDEFKTDALRLGYKVYASIETIGNYQATHQPGVKYPTNYDQAQNPANDTRKEYMEITSEYYLYDFNTGKFYAIDLWSGPEGAKQCIYSGSDRKVHAQENSEPLYINMDEEFYRRNVSDLEEMVSKSSYRVNTTNGENSVYTALMSGLEFIGYTGYIKLDTMDLTYCGSNAVQGIEGYNNSSMEWFTKRDGTSQRWHFTSGLTSTTVPTMPIYKDGTKLTATQVENAYRDLHEKHPNSVIIEFQNYIAKGSVWTLKYKGSLMNSDTIRFYDKEDDCPYKNKDHIETEYKGYKVYNPATEKEYEPQYIDPDSTPFVAYEAYKSNSEDRTTAGTH